MKRLFLHIVFLAVVTVAMADKVGTWKLYPSYTDITEVQYTRADSSEVFVLAGGNLFAYYNSDHTFSEFMIEGAESATGTSFDVLSGRNIKHIAWCATIKKLVIVYSDGLIDILNAKDRSNPTTGPIVGLKETSLFSDKEVSAIYVKEQYAYLATASHIIKIDVKDEYIVKTYDTTTITDVDGLKPENIVEPVALDYKYGMTTIPDGPNTNFWWRLTINNGKVYCADGEYDVQSAGTNLRPGNVKIWDGSSWSALQKNIVTEKCSEYKGASQAIVDPTDASHVFVAAFSGLYEFKDAVFVNYYNKDDYLGNTKEAYDLLLTGVFDSKGRLWVDGYYSDCLAVFDTSKQWTKKFHPNEFNGLENVAVQGMLEDSRGLIWLCSSRWENSRLFCYNADSDVLKRYDKYCNQDGISYSPWIRNIAEDKNGNIWIATNVGPLYLSAEDFSENEETMTQPKVNRDDGTGLADYLLSGVDIRSIVVDNANNKWFATNGNGIYAVSDDCNTQLCHFTEDNSPICSNIVWDVKYDNLNGVVYFATDKGLCSYQTDVTSTYGELDEDNVYAYPNPVTPEYTGNITIMGLTNGCSLKIANAAGHIVHSGTCNGGSYTWNGCDSTGTRVGSGVYMVLVADAEGEDGCVTKIAVVK